jgi:pilus assembly protein CpaF
MFTVVITEKGGEQRRMDFDKSEVTIGRVQGNDIILPKGNVSKRHSRIVLKDGKFIIVDLKSTNGTYVNGRKITSPLVVKPTDKIYVGDFILSVDESEGAKAGAGPGSIPPRRAPAAPMRRPTPDDEEEPLAAADGDEPADLDNDEELSSPSIEDEVEEDESGADIRATPSPSLPPISTLPPPSSAQSQPPRQGASSSPGLSRPSPPVRSASGAPTGGSPVRARHPSNPSVPSAGMTDAPAAAPTSPRPRTASVQAALPEPTVGPGRKSIPPPLREAPARMAPAAAARPSNVRPSGGDGRRAKLAEAAREIYDRLGQAFDMSQLEGGHDETLWERVEEKLGEIVERVMMGNPTLAQLIEAETLTQDLLKETLAFGPLDDLLADPEIMTILVNRPDEIFIDRGGELELTDRAFSGDGALVRVIERLTGHPAGTHGPVCEGRLSDGSRVSAVLPPLAVHGPCLTIRRPLETTPTLEGLVDAHVMSAAIAEFLELALGAKRNIVVAGPAGAQTALLSALAAAAPSGERVVSVENASVLELRRSNHIALEVRRPDYSMRELLHEAVRLRPDRLLVGEVVGPEALDLIQMMASGVDGALVGVHGTSARDAMDRLQLLMQAAGSSLRSKAARELVAQAVHVVVQVGAPDGGVARVTSVAEVVGPGEADGLEIHELFLWEAGGRSNGSRGRFVPLGIVPRFCEDLSSRGIPVNSAIFRE